MGAKGKAKHWGAQASASARMRATSCVLNFLSHVLPGKCPCQTPLDFLLKGHLPNLAGGENPREPIGLALIPEYEVGVHKLEQLGQGCVCVCVCVCVHVRAGLANFMVLLLH